MALDGIVIANIVHELRGTILNGRINRISQPENDELILTIKGDSDRYRLLLSAGAGLPLVYLTDETKTNPITAPNFCMLLRKHLNNSKIVDIYQPNMERIVNFKIEHFNELGDLCNKYLIIELMGKHSNIIFCDEDMLIIDAIKRVNKFVSSVREVLPGKKYFVVDNFNKANPFDLDFDSFKNIITNKSQTIEKALYRGITGISPLVANEVCYRASIDSADSTKSLTDEAILHLHRNFTALIDGVKEGNFSPNIIKKDGMAVEFSSINLSSYNNHDYLIESYSSPSTMLEDYYASKSNYNRIRQKSANLRKIVNNHHERSQKKYDLQVKQLKDTDKRDKFKLYGELITAYGHSVEEGTKELKAHNYYNDEEILIPLDSTLSPIENANRYYKRYNKLKRTYESLSSLVKETAEDLSHLESIQTALDIATDEEDLNDIREELVAQGYLRKKASKGKKQNRKKKSKPLHYISSDGFHIYVGKNNYQNDYLTFKYANGDDWWFHAKQIPGSHVIVKTDGKDLPDKTKEEAASLAAHYSKASKDQYVEVDYTPRKHLKKVKGGKPGFVIYQTYKSMVATTNISGIQQV